MDHIVGKGSIAAEVKRIYAGRSYRVWELGPLDEINPYWRYLPYVIQVFLESMLRHEDGETSKVWPSGRLVRRAPWPSIRRGYCFKTSPGYRSL